MRWAIYSATAISILLPGCTGDQLLYLMSRPSEMRIGFHSVPTTVPTIGGVSIELMPLNNNYYRNPDTFVVCFIGPAKFNATYHKISFDPSKVVLVRADGNRVHPQAYGEDSVCPRGDYFRPIAEIFEFKPVIAGITASSLTRSPKASVFSDIALQFGVKTIAPEDEFSVELNSVEIDGKSHAVPPITFAKVYGYKYKWSIAPASPNEKNIRQATRES